MIGILIITHEFLGEAHYSLAKHFFPNSDFSHMRILNVDKSEDHGDILNRMQALLPELDSGSGILVLTDIFGATPCNAMLKMISVGQVALISGLNAPMLIKAVSKHAQYDDLTVLTEEVKQAGIDGIMALTEPLNG